MVGQILKSLVCHGQEAVTVFRIGKLLDDECQSAAVCRVKFALGIPQRREVDVANLFALFGLRVRPGVLPGMKRQLRTFRDRLVWPEAYLV